MVVSRLVAGRVAVIRVHGLDAKQDIYLGRHTGRPATAAQNAFWEFALSPRNAIIRELSLADGVWSPGGVAELEGNGAAGLMRI
jgi:hypothetical protein